MEINPLNNVKVKDIVAGYIDNSDKEEGIYGYGGKLNIRPKYQRNFVYDDKKREAVIHTLGKGFPLGIMYWAKNDDDTYEIIDGQQRTISICQFIADGMKGKGFFVSGLFGNEKPFCWNDLSPSQQKELLDRNLIVYECVGADRERLDWFDTINIAGEKLSQQEIRNAQYNCAWLTDARRYFSKSHNNAAKKYGDYYIQTDWNRQEGLEKVIRWLIGDLKGKDEICKFMGDMKQKSDIDDKTQATELWEYYKSVIDWARKLFPKKRLGMNKVEWGILFNNYHDKKYDIAKIEETVAKLYADEDVTTKEGIYEYIFDNSESHLHIRQFSPEIKTHVYELQKQKCKDCGQHFELPDLQAHHSIRWIDGGHTTIDNCVLLCRNCHGNRHRSE